MKKMHLLSHVIILVFLLSACSSNVSQEEYDALVAENKSLKAEIELLQSENQSFNTNEDEVSNLTSDTDDTSWDFIINNYPQVTYDDIKAGNYNNQYVILSTVIDNIDYSSVMNWFSCNAWYSHENTYTCDDITFRCDELSNYSPQELQAGDNLDICFFINKDSSFGSDIKGFNKIDDSMLLEDIYNSFKQNCTPMNWENVMRNPDGSFGTTYSITGTIFQIVSENDRHIELLLSISNDKYTHVFYTYKDNEPKLLENDTLTVYGTFYRLYKYISVLGTNQSVPSITAEFIDIN